MPKHDSPFKEGDPGKIYAELFSESQTGHQAALNRNMPTNKAYQFKRRYPDLFEEVDDGMLAAIDPILDAIEEDLEDADVSLSDSERGKLRDFLNQDWREAYGKAVVDLEEHNLEIDPYSLFQIAVGDAYALLAIDGGQLDKISTDELGGLQEREHGKEFDSLSSALRAVLDLPVTLLAKLSQMPLSQQAISMYQAQSSAVDIGHLLSQSNTNYTN